MRYKAYLKERYRALCGYMGSILITIGGVFLLPLLTLLFYPEEVVFMGAFLASGIPLVIVGGFLRWRFIPKEADYSVTLPEGMLSIVLTWLIASLMGAFPFVFTVGLTYSQAVFEAVSGWSTTGITVVDVESAPRILLMYRSILQAAGGAGFVILALAVLTGPVGAGLSLAEGHGEQLAPHVRRSAWIVIRIYAGYILIGIFALRLVGMTWFDAVNHALTSVSTGGFSTHTDSIGHYDSAWVEGVIIVLMLLGATNFLTAYTLLNGKFGPVIRNGEIRVALGIFVIVIPLVFLATTLPLYVETGKAFRVAVFETVSVLSGAGFSTVDHTQWNAFGLLVVIVLMSIGGSSGSTSGGLKLVRVYVIIKALRWEFRRSFMPDHAVNQPTIWQGDRRGFITDAMVRSVALYIFLYLFAFITLSAVIALHGFDISRSLFQASSTLGTAGLSIGVTSHDMPPTLLWTQTLGMFLGRLEFFGVFVGVSKLLQDAVIMSRK